MSFLFQFIFCPSKFWLPTNLTEKIEIGKVTSSVFLVPCKKWLVQITRLLYTLHWKRYQKNTTMFIWSDCICFESIQTRFIILGLHSDWPIVLQQEKHKSKTLFSLCSLHKSYFMQIHALHTHNVYVYYTLNIYSTLVLQGDNGTTDHSRPI